jgi:hypothetical protein
MAFQETSKPAKSPGIPDFRAVDGCHRWRTLALDGIVSELFWLLRSTLLCVRVDFHGRIDAPGVLLALVALRFCCLDVVVFLWLN